MKKLLLTVLLFTVFGSLFAQYPQRRDFEGIIEGRVLDANQKIPIEYTNVILFSSRDSSQVTGGISDKSGTFILRVPRPGNFYVELKFMGYYTKTLDRIVIRPDNPNLNLGDILLQPAILMMQGVQVEEDKTAIEYKIDKKVINVSQQLTTVSGTAVDVLENVPSVTVDIEGNVQLRGSGSFTVLLNDRPTVLDPSDVLQQIPASTIDNIEIITNPSAKYDPDGVSGIINVITKKGKMDGLHGLVNVNAGYNGRNGGDFLFNYRQESYNIYFGADFNRFSGTGTDESESKTTANDTISYIYSEGESDRSFTRYGLRTGIDLYLSKKDVLSVGVRYGGRAMEFQSDEDFETWMEPGESGDLYTSYSESKRGGDFYWLNMDYQHDFARKGHKLNAQVNFSRRYGDEESLDELKDLNGLITSGHKSTEDGPSRRWRMKFEYVLPLRENDRFEAGYQNRLRVSEDITTADFYNNDTGVYETFPEFNHTTSYERNIHSLYTLYAAELGSFGIQGGIRGEYTDRLIELEGENEQFVIDRWDLFPTLHMSYKLPDKNQFMISYTRRIDRPRGWYLEPFITWSDAYNVRTGNPALKPEYIDSYELGYQKSFGRNMVSVEGYYRVTHNKVERVRSVYATNVMLHTTENVGQDYNLGAELMMNIEPVKWYNLNLMGNFYDYKVEGILYDEPFSRSSFNWGIRMNNTFKLAKYTRIQINGMYNSPSVSSQGTREGFVATNLAFRQEFAERKWSATLQIRDLFKTAKHESTSEGPDFYYYRLGTRGWPMVSVTLTYNFNNQKQDKRQMQEMNGEFEGEGESDFE